jgi:twinkle protein
MISVESKAKAYVVRKGWNFTESGVDQLVGTCPLCGRDDKFYINISGSNKDGLWQCFVCNESGHLTKLMTELGDVPTSDRQISLRDFAMNGRVLEPLPNVEAAHRRLLEDGDSLDYLVATRGFTMDVIEQMKLGVEDFDGKKWLLIPYFHNSELVFVKHRTLPPAEKAFRGSTGREASLYNEDVITRGMPELLFVEGEADALSCLSNGIPYVVGIPGANVKKAAWITKVDRAAPGKIYLCYDTDEVGQKAAHEIAARIGIDKCMNILLPPFETVDSKKGKDINEWFVAGHTLDEFEKLKADARPFDVEGVVDLPNAIEELENQILGRGVLEPTLVTCWPSLNQRIGGFEWGDVCGVIAEGKIGKTTFALNLLDYYAQIGHNCFFYCLEMPPIRLARKWISYATQTDDSPGASQITVDTIHRARDIAFKREGELFFGYTRAKSAEQVFETIRQAVRRYGVKVVCFDNLQFLVRSIEHSAQETARISKQFKDLAMELGIFIVLIIQPNRPREGEIVAARNAHGSSAIEKDVDYMIALHRNRVAKIKADDFQGFMEAEDNFDPQLLVRVDLSRYSAGGVCTLWMDGSRSTVREFNPDELLNTPRPLMGTEIPVEQQQAV